MDTTADDTSTAGDTTAADDTAAVGLLRSDAEALLRRLVGREDATLREDQWRAVEALVAHRRRVLVVQRTGWGKSAVYFVATGLLRAHGAGPTVIVSPLLALMRNQVDAARRAGIRAETIHSANTEEWDSVHERVAAGTVDVLLVSPERLTNPAFRDQVLPRLAQEAGLVVVDEAHCISDWGHDFRPDYRRIASLLTELPAGTPVLATTATANARVTRDVAEQLGVGAEGDEALVLRGTLDRESLHLSVLPTADQATRLAWLTRTLPTLGGSGIVYCLTVSAAEQVTEHLRAEGLAVRAYTGRTDPAERLRCEEDLLSNEVLALVATSALGMGYDKPDLAFVVHLGAPPSPVAYYQQVGRAGRATRRAEVVLVPGTEDRAVWDWFAASGFPEESQVRAVLAALDEADKPLSTAALEPRVELRRTRLELLLKVLDVDGAVRRVQGGWVATGQTWHHDTERYRRVDEARRAEERLMLEYAADPPCRMAFLRATLDDPELPPGWTCGRCDRCTGARPGQEVDEDAVRQARDLLARPGTAVDPRRQWPTGMASLGIRLTGRIPAELQAAPGRAVARLDALGLGTAVRELVTEGGDGELPPALRGPVLAVLQEWAPRADAVLAVGSQRRPTLVSHLAAGVARRLDVPLLGPVTPAPGPSRHDVNSARRLADVVGRLGTELPPEIAAAVADRDVLLVDDRVDTGWTVTVLAAAARRAGARSVTPFVLGTG